MNLCVDVVFQTVFLSLLMDVGITRALQSSVHHYSNSTNKEQTEEERIQAFSCTKCTLMVHK